MLCIIQQHDGQITGWIIASDTHDARRRAQAAGDVQLAQLLYTKDFVRPGKHDLGNGYTMLVD